MSLNSNKETLDFLTKKKKTLKKLYCDQNHGINANQNYKTVCLQHPKSVLTAIPKNMLEMTLHINRGCKRKKKQKTKRIDFSVETQCLVF